MLPQSGEGPFPLVERHLSPSCRSADPPPRANCCRCPDCAVWRGAGPKGLLLRRGISQASASYVVAQPLRGTWWEVWPQYPRLLRALSLRVAQQRFLVAYRGMEAAHPRVETQHGSGGPRAGRDMGILHPLEA